MKENPLTISDSLKSPAVWACSSPDCDQNIVSTSLLLRDRKEVPPTRCFFFLEK